MRGRKIALAAPDSHVPYQHPGALKAFNHMAKAIQPDYIIYTGDQVDLKMVIDHWKHNPSPDTLLANYKEFDDIMNYHMKICPKAEIVFIEGNHEERVRRLLDTYPMLRGTTIELEKYFQFEKRGIDFLPYDSENKRSGVYRIDDLYYSHGNYYVKYHAYKMGEFYRRNMRYGHVHDYQVHTHMTPLDTAPQTSMSIGCMCSPRPHYQKGFPNRWIVGFHIAYFGGGKCVGDYFLPVIDNKVTYGGVVYG